MCVDRVAFQGKGKPSGRDSDVSGWPWEGLGVKRGAGY
jgi:hypothetical protein